MKKFVQNNARTATVTLDGGECEVIFGSRYNVFSVQSENDITVSLESGRTAGDDGVMLCKGGESIMYPHMMRLDRLYITGTGKVNVFASNEAVNPFKKRGKGGESSGEKYIKSEAVTTYNYANFRAWFDSEIKPAIEDIFDFYYVSPYGDAGEWLVWSPKPPELSVLFGGMQMYGNYINLQAYYSAGGGHDYARGNPFRFYRKGNTVIFGCGDSIAHYAYFGDEKVVLAAGKWCEDGSGFVSQLPSAVADVGVYGGYGFEPYTIPETGRTLKNVFTVTQSGGNAVLPIEFTAGGENYVRIRNNVAVKM
ncbi:MAG: hypothetical protein NC120_05160 [Ruminococcus sp.]|nr:hypothetical protein [Ruminococcus sp.]